MNRLAYFFAVIALRVVLVFLITTWAVSDYAGVVISGDIGGWAFQAASCQEGFAVSAVEVGALLWRVEVVTPSEVAEITWVFDPSEYDQSLYPTAWRWPGMILLCRSGKAMASGRYWLLIALASLAYALVEIQRRRRSNYATGVPKAAERDMQFRSRSNVVQSVSE